ncbi:MAG: hypothetical protein A3B70_01785 [Deltaproteobacteria bacterium RIFCSPHIGHO2_02_FULL_40_11]|nr:MAG: hypothetical protein A3B70_01785 [Deltaproteobacteria bacterium RIFCSPHIGHO2_02_FULL_40_11]
MLSDFLSKWILFLMVLLLLASGVVWGQISSNESIQFFEMEKGHVLYIKDHAHPNRGYYVTLPFRVRDVFWDETAFLLNITLSSHFLSEEAYHHLKMETLTSNLLKLPITNVEFEWDDQVLKDALSFVIVHAPNSISGFTLIFKLEKKCWEKLKAGAGQKLGLTGKIKLSYTGLENEERSVIILNRQALFQDLLQYEAKEKFQVWEKEKALSTMQKLTKSVPQHQNSYWLNLLFNFYFECDEGEKGYRLRSFTHLPNQEEQFYINVAHKKTSTTEFPIHIGIPEAINREITER